ncbi:MAG: hypothetical protein AAGC43_04515 [Bacteroidota bacterium]
MAISKVKSVQANGTWEANGNTFYQFEYEMEDGTVMAASHKSENGFHSVGTEVEYEVKRENNFGKSGSVKKPYNGGGQGNQNSSGGGGKPNYQNKSGQVDTSKVASMALAYAKDLVVAVGGSHDDANSLVDYTLQIAERFNTWINSKS